MADRSAIEWTDATWNPVTGCTEVSPGCDNCYARTFAERWRGTRGHHFEAGFDLTLRPERLPVPLRWRRPRRVFVNSMSDLFHTDVPDRFIASVFAVMAMTPRHTYQVLTKRPGRMRSLLSRRMFAHWVCEAGRELAGCQQDWMAAGAMFGNHPTPTPLPNVWLGTSVESQRWAEIRVPLLLDTPAAVRWISAEPLLGPVDLTRVQLVTPRALYRPAVHLDVLQGLAVEPDELLDSRIDWVVCGGESGHGARPIDPDWARSLRDQCHQSGVPFLFKQWGGRTPKAGGRELDGRTWDEYPSTGHAGAGPVGGAA
ncbi:MAG TPA: phage Gp37/Gp68 family protein [Pseudonocardiaceae bacterium]